MTSIKTIKYLAGTQHTLFWEQLTGATALLVYDTIQTYEDNKFRPVLGHLQV